MGDKIKVEGCADYSVSVTCPNEACLHHFDATDNDDDSTVTNAMFENTSDSCADMQIDMMCPKCECEFILDSIVY